MRLVIGVFVRSPMYGIILDITPVQAEDVQGR
jgi:hypothetical protein